MDDLDLTERLDRARERSRDDQQLSLIRCLTRMMRPPS